MCAYVTVEGNFYNNGEIATNAANDRVNFFCKGNIESRGKWNSNYTKLNRSMEQMIGINDSSFSINLTKLNAVRTGNSYKWLLNGTPLSNSGKITGATSSELSIQNTDSSTLGVYSCKIDSNGTINYSRNISINNAVTGINENISSLPKSFMLYQKYPNPFNPGTIINYQLPVGSYVSLIVYNILGRKVAELINNEWKEPGYHQFNFSAVGYHLSRGIYFYNLQPDRYSNVKKFVVMK